MERGKVRNSLRVTVTVKREGINLVRGLGIYYLWINGPKTAYPKMKIKTKSTMLEAQGLPGQPEKMEIPQKIIRMANNNEIFMDKNSA